MAAKVEEFELHDLETSQQQQQQQQVRSPPLTNIAGDAVTAEDAEKSLLALPQMKEPVKSKRHAHHEPPPPMWFTVEFAVHYLVIGVAAYQILKAAFEISSSKSSRSLC